MDRLFFYSKSANKSPGKGVNEFVSNPLNYQQLAAIPDWRQQLSNFYVSNFQYQYVSFRTVEHMFQAYKINLADPQKALQFTINSGSVLGLGDGEMARSQRKMVILTPQQLNEWDSGLKDRALYWALYSKFSQNPNLRHTLLSTGNAELWHGTRGTPTTRQFILERVRQDLRSQISI